ncbi:MAG: radical SAM protein [Patescibacteria group bacterium]
MSKKQKDPLEVVAIAFTNRCNLNCPHCGYDCLNRDKSQELSVEFYAQLLKEARDLGAGSVNITGGEIFLRPDVMDLIERAVDMGYFVTLESNGTLITDADISKLKTFKKQVRIAISLDGITREVHERVRGPKTFERTLAVLRALSNQQIPSRVNSVLQIGNMHEIPDIARFAVDELGIGFRLLPFILEYGKGACACKTDGVPYEEIESLTEGFLYPFMRARGEDANITVGLKMALVPIDITGHLICPWGQSMIGVGPTGVASLCHVANNRPEFVFGDLKEKSLADIWHNNERLMQFRTFDPDTLMGVCGNCLARTVCRGGCRLNAFSSYKALLAPDPQCQAVYNLGKFPSHALDEVDCDCRYGI